MVVGEYSIFSAMRRMETFSLPSLTKSSLAASRISWRRNFFCRALRSLTPKGKLLNTVKYIYILEPRQALSFLLVPVKLVACGDRLHLEMAAAQDGGHADKLPRRKVSRKIGFVDGVEFVVIGEVGRGNLDIHEVVHRETGLGQKCLVGVQQKLDLVFDFVGSFARFRIKTDISGQIERVAHQNGIAERSLGRALRQIDDATLRLRVALRKSPMDCEESADR